MREPMFAACAGVFLTAIALLPIAEEAAAVLEFEKGNFWMYSAEIDSAGMSISASVKMKIVGTESSGESAVYLIAITGSGDVSGTFNGSAVSGDVGISGEERRLVSNFSLVSSDLMFYISISMQGVAANMTMSMLVVYSPAIDDFIGDRFPGYGVRVNSNCTVTATTSMSMELGGETFSYSDSFTTTAFQTIEVASTNQTVVVPAGSFDCYQYTKTLLMGGESSVLTYYYSSEVGSYVKTTGSDDLLTTLGEVELESYSYAGRGAGISSLLSGTNLLLITLAIVAVVVIVGLVIAMRRRGRAQVQIVPPPQVEDFQQALPPPPPPPPPPSQTAP